MRPAEERGRDPGAFGSCAGSTRQGRFVFISERGAPFPQRFFKMLAGAAESIGMAGVHPHLLRHATGFKLVNQGVDTRTLAAYLGHRQIANTARYTKMDARRFDGFWQD